METIETNDDLRDKKIQLLSSLAESCWKEYDTRRSYEWKVNFALWASFGIIAGFSIKEGFSFDLWVWLIIAFLAGIYIWWQFGLHSSSRHDQKKRHFYEEEGRLLMGINLPDDLKKPPQTSNKYLFFNWSHGSQTLITFSFLVLLGVILTSDFNKPNDNKKHKDYNHFKTEYMHNRMHH